MDIFNQINNNPPDDLEQMAEIYLPMFNLDFDADFGTLDTNLTNAVDSNVMNVLNADDQIIQIEFTDDELIQHLVEFETDPPPRKLQKSEKTSRFAKCSEEQLTQLEDDRHEKKTKDSTTWSVRLFKEWRRDNNLAEEFEELPIDELANDLRQFYGDVRKTNGERYSKSSLRSLRAALQRYLTSPPYNRSINIITMEQFNAANNVFDGSLKKIKRSGHDQSVGYPEITDDDLTKLFAGETLTMNDPISLQRLVFFNLQYYFCRRGREGLRELTKESFAIRKDSTGREYITPTSNEHEKNHQGNKETQYRQMNNKVFATGDRQCPVASFKLYLSKLNPACPWLYQQPKKSLDGNKSPFWYNNVPLGHNTIGNLMKGISKEAGLSKIYTNHSIRATTIRVLNDAGTSDRIICSLSGHRNVNSIKSYCRDASEGQKRNMTDTLSMGRGVTSSGPSSTAATSFIAEALPNERSSETSSSEIVTPIITSPVTATLATPATLPRLSRFPIQPHLTSEVVRREPTTAPTATALAPTVQASASILNMLAPSNSQRQPQLFSDCNFNGATLNFHFSN